MGVCKVFREDAQEMLKKDGLEITSETISVIDEILNKYDNKLKIRISYNI